MTEINIEELEKALSPSKREKKPGKKKEEEKLPKTKQALLDEAKRLNEEIDTLGYRQLSSRYEGENWSFSRWGDLRKGYSDVTLDEIPVQVLRRMVLNGRRRLEEFHGQVNSLVEKNPTEALESNLEGKTGMDVIRFIFYKKQDQLTEVLDNTVSILNEHTRCWMKFELEGPIESEITYYSEVGRTHTNIQGIALYPHSPKDAEKTVNFLNNFDQVIEQVKSQISQIKIKEVTK